MTTLPHFSQTRKSQPTAMPAATGPAWTCDFVINGRFLSQPVTGVQRYAREITAAMDALLSRTNGRAEIIAPQNVVDAPDYDSTVISIRGAMRGYLWEQLELPLFAQQPILSLCNVGPAVSTSQVVCIHDASVFTEPDSYTLSFRSVYKAMLPRLAKCAATITTVSETSRQDITHHLPVSAKKIRVIPNGHEHVYRWRPSRSVLARTMRIERPFVFMLGSQVQHKNNELILQLADDLAVRGVDLVVAGGAAKIYSIAAKERNVRVLWLGRVTDDDLAYLYQHALCLAFPSRSEGFGLPIVEAMALGCPVVTSDRGSMLEVSGGATLLASPNDPGAWLERFAALKSSSTLGSELRERGFERVKRFSWTESARAYLELCGRDQ